MSILTPDKVHAQKGADPAQVEKLRQAISAAVKLLNDQTAKQAARASDIREILVDIALDALQPLPVTIRMILPPDDQHRIVGVAAINSIIYDLKELRCSLD